MQKHLDILGYLHIGLSVFALLIAILVFTVVTGAGLFSGDLQVIALLGGIGTGVAIFLSMLALPGLVAGIGLLKRKSWARPLTMVVGVLDLLNFPFGTVLGAYSLWAMMQDETKLLLTR